jgi:hypothetical protein
MKANRMQKPMPKAATRAGLRKWLFHDANGETATIGSTAGIDVVRPMVKYTRAAPARFSSANR